MVVAITSQTVLLTPAHCTGVVMMTFLLTELTRVLNLSQPICRYTSRVITRSCNRATHQVSAEPQ